MFETLASLTDADLHRMVRVRNQPQTVLEAIFRQMTHYSLHLGQILVIGKHLLGDRCHARPAAAVPGPAGHMSTLG
jgi:hypothetical protein